MAVRSRSAVTATRTGFFIIGAWVEPGSSVPLRAQIRLTTDVSIGFERSLTIAQSETVVEAFQAGLLEMAAGSGPFRDDSDGPRSR
jgi:hypothetical protein